MTVFSPIFNSHQRTVFTVCFNRFYLVFQTPTRMVLSSAYITLGCSSLHSQTPSHSSHTSFLKPNAHIVRFSYSNSTLQIFLSVILPCSGRISDRVNVWEGPLVFSYMHSIVAGKAGPSGSLPHEGLGVSGWSQSQQTKKQRERYATQEWGAEYSLQSSPPKSSRASPTSATT